MPIIQINLMEGRSPAQKRALVASVTDAVVEALGADPQSVRILIHELQPENYALAGITAAEQSLASRPGHGSNGHSKNSSELGEAPR